MSKPFDPCWIDDTHPLSCIVEVRGQCITIGTGGLKTDVRMIDPLLPKPGRKLSKPLLIVGEHLVLQLVVDQKRHVKLAFCTIDTEYSFCHTSLPFSVKRSRYTPCPNQPCTYKLFLLRGGLRYRTSCMDRTSGRGSNLQTMFADIRCTTDSPFPAYLERLMLL